MLNRNRNIIFKKFKNGEKTYLNVFNKINRLGSFGALVMTIAMLLCLINCRFIIIIIIIII